METDNATVNAGNGALEDPFAISMAAIPAGVDEELLDENTTIIDNFVQSYLNQLETSKRQNDSFMQTATMRACTQDLDNCASKLGVELEVPSPP